MLYDAPDASVIIPAYQAAADLPTALRSLEEQDHPRPFEAIVVNSGGERFTYRPAEQRLRVRIIDFEERLWPGRARNAGLAAARGEVIAFMPADSRAAPSWLSARIAAHAAGADLVGGAILNGTPRHPVGTAEYLLEYSALLPIGELLRQQSIPHAASFKRGVFDRIGLYPEDTRTGEDTIFNRRCIEAGLTVDYCPQAGIAHRSSRELTALVSHAFAHGRGLAQCVRTHRLGSAIGPPGQPLALAAWRALAVYPLSGFAAKITRLRRFAPRRLPSLLLLSPLVMIGLLATGAGALAEQLRARE